MIAPVFRPPRVAKPEIVMVCDLSGSMATFARFTLQLTYAVRAEFSKVRAFGFVDGTDDLTGFFGDGADFSQAMGRVAGEARLVWADGHSDYGASFRMLADRFPDAIGPRTTLIVTGDARNNYRRSAREAFAALSLKSRAVYWLNPEPRRYWNTGDSVVDDFEDLCDRVDEVRTLRQLEAFVESLAAEPGVRSSRRILAATTAVAGR